MVYVLFPSAKVRSIYLMRLYMIFIYIYLYVYFFIWYFYILYDIFYSLIKSAIENFVTFKLQKSGQFIHITVSNGGPAPIGVNVTEFVTTLEIWNTFALRWICSWIVAEFVTTFEIWNLFELFCALAFDRYVCNVFLKNNGASLFHLSSLPGPRDR